MIAGRRFGPDESVPSVRNEVRTVWLRVTAVAATPYR